MKYNICSTQYLLQHLDASGLFVQLLLLVFHLCLKVAKLLLDLGQRGFILGLLGGRVLKLSLQLLHLYICGAHIAVLVLQAGGDTVKEHTWTSPVMSYREQGDETCRPLARTSQYLECSSVRWLTCSCWRRLNISPAIMSFSRASFSLWLLSLCTSAWDWSCSMSNLENTHTHTDRQRERRQLSKMLLSHKTNISYPSSTPKFAGICKFFKRQLARSLLPAEELKPNFLTSVLPN